MGARTLPRWTQDDDLVVIALEEEEVRDYVARQERLGRIIEVSPVGAPPLQRASPLGCVPDCTSDSRVD